MDTLIQVITVVGTLAALVFGLIYFARWQDDRQRNYMNDMKSLMTEMKNDLKGEMRDMRSDMERLRDKVEDNGERLARIEGILGRAWPEGRAHAGAPRGGKAKRARPDADERKRATG